MIHHDLTKTGRGRHRSGLTRVSGQLREHLAGSAQDVTWEDGLRDLRTRAPVAPRAEDWFLTSELFSETERPGFSAFLEARPCRLAAVFHDAIPLKHPHITWPQSVARHPAYMKLLARFDRVWAVSAASREELLGFWTWQGIRETPPVGVLALGADFTPAPRVTEPATPPGPAQLLCVGIIEPRKNQSFLLGVCADLWTKGAAFELHLVGRVNPHFGRPIVAEIKDLQRRFGPRLQFHEAASDAAVSRLYANARGSLFPTIAEGCGLPLLESLWMGVPCLCSDLPALRENFSGGGCLPLPCGDRTAWGTAISRLLSDAELHRTLVREATTRPLPTWAAAADVIRQDLR